MKANRSALGSARIRCTLLGLALVGTVGVVFCLGESLAARFGQTTAFPTEGGHAPSLSISDLFAAAHQVVDVFRLCPARLQQALAVRPQKSEAERLIQERRFHEPACALVANGHHRRQERALDVVGTSGTPLRSRLADGTGGWCGWSGPVLQGARRLGSGLSTGVGTQANQPSRTDRIDIDPRVASSRRGGEPR